MTVVLALVVALCFWVPFVRFAPARVVGRVGFWWCVLAGVHWSLNAVVAAVGHRWLSLLWDLLWAAACVVGACAWSDTLRRDRAKSAANAGGAP